MDTKVNLKLYEVHQVLILPGLLLYDAMFQHKLSVVNQVLCALFEIFLGYLHSFPQIFQILGPFIQHIDPHIIFDLMTVHLGAHVLEL